MEKILIYVNSWDEVTQLIENYDKFSVGREIAWATDSNQLVQLLSVGKLLVVNPDTYYPDFVVSNQKIDAELVISIKEFLEVIQ